MEGEATALLDLKCPILALTLINNILKFKINGNQSKKNESNFIIFTLKI